MNNIEKKKNSGCLSIIIYPIVFFILIGIFSSSPHEEDEVPNTFEETEIVNDNEEIEKEIISVKSKIVYDKNNVKIKLKSIEETALTYIVNLKIINNSNLNLGFHAHAYSINNIMTKNNIYEMGYDIASGKKATAQLEIEKSLLKELGVSKLKKIDLMIWAYDNEKSFKEFETDIIAIRTNLDNKKYKKIKGEKVYDKNNIFIEYVGQNNNEYTYCLTNKTGEYFNFDIENISFNNYAFSETDYDIYNMIVFDNSSIIFTLKPSEEFMETNNVKNVKKIEFSLAIRPLDDYFKERNSDIIKTKIK